jgi:hypothetical protein
LNKLVASDGAAGDYLGSAVALSGNVTLVGQSAEPVLGAATTSGNAYLFDISTGAQLSKLTPSDGAARDGFGFSVAINDGLALVGSPFDDDNGTDSGSVYLFDVATGIQLAKLKPADGAPNAFFGYSVAISGNIALVGGFFQGSAYVFDITSGQQLAKLKPADGAPSGFFGASVALSGNVALVGRYGDDENGPDSGSAYLFNATTGQQIAKLKPADGAADDRFGGSVAISGNTALVGSEQDDDNDPYSGSAYLFDITTGQQIAKLKPADGAAFDTFGRSVAISGNTALVGSPFDDNSGFASGSAYLFNVTTGQQIAKLKPADGESGDFFGSSVALSGNTAIVGSSRDDDNGTDSGSAYVFTFDVIAPEIVSSAFAPEQAHHFTVTFNEPINPLSLSLAKVTATRVGQMTGINPTSVTWSADHTVATFTFPTLPDGNYRFTLGASAVTDQAGNQLASDGVLEGPDVFILAGDANRDRRVDFADLLILAQNYGQSGKTFSQGNFDYSPDGLVDFSDLLILAQNYNVSLIRPDPRPATFSPRAAPRRSPLEPDEPVWN